jgi:hypothetical protein
MRTRVFVLASLVLAAATGAQAQMAVSGAVGGSTQSAGASDIPYLGPPFGGTSVAIVGGVDFPIARNVSLGGEASLATAISGDQSRRASIGTSAFLSRHRDSVFSGVMKIGTPFERRIHAAFVVGGGAAYRRTAREGTTSSLFPPTSRTPFSETVSDFVLAYSVGGDVDVRVASRLRILAVARWHKLADDDLQPDGIVKRGVSSRIVRYGAGARFRF